MPKKSSPILKIILTLIFLIPLIAGSYIYFWWQDSLKPFNPENTSEQKIIIPKGYSTKQIGSLLEEDKIIKNSLAFRLLVDRKNLGSKLQAGSYTLTSSQNLEEIINTLTQGTQDFWVTIPEGKRREEIAFILSKEFKNQGLKFSIPDFLDESENLEGYLFPDTYLLPRNITASEIVTLLRTTFDQKIPDEIKIKASNLGLEFQDLIIIASLVEREAKFDIDRPKVARVILNRLAIDMALQIDASVQYPVGTAECITKIGQECNWWPVITNTKYKSDYNTYQNPGLPPGPICNPGLKSTEAVLNPDQHNYLYYLSEPGGKTHYAETLEKHNQNIKKYLN